MQMRARRYLHAAPAYCAPQLPVHLAPCSCASICSFRPRLQKRLPPGQRCPHVSATRSCKCPAHLLLQVARAIAPPICPLRSSPCNVPAFAFALRPCKCDLRKCDPALRPNKKTAGASLATEGASQSAHRRGPARAYTPNGYRPLVDPLCDQYVKNIYIYIYWPVPDVQCEKPQKNSYTSRFVRVILAQGPC